MVRSIRIATTLVMLAGASSVSPFLHTAGAQDGPAAAAPRVEKAAGAEKNNVYIVQMADPAVVAYTGGVAGLNRTKPLTGEKLNPASPEVQAYSSYLESRQDRALAAVGGGRKLYVYRHTFNGFAAEMTAEQADALRATEGVVQVTKDELRYGTTATTPHFLGLDDPDSGLWKKLGGVRRAGENVVIGVVDSGVWPESGSFSDRPGQKGGGRYAPLLDWHGLCEKGEEFKESDCNQKLIGARFYNAGYGGDAGIKASRPWEFVSPRDFNGHGTHTASTAGGNHAVTLTGPAAGLGTISGIAPRARIAVYKALWATSDGQASGFTSDLVAAIDQAVADGVDVINYSVSGTSTNFLDPVELSFLYAADAGVFVAASAGNSGPTVATVAHPSPWITTVGAGTHDRSSQAGVVLGNGITYTGPSLATAVGPAPLIDSINAGLPGANPTALSLCYTATDNGGVAVLDPAKVAGKIVVCDRGVSARTNKSLAVYEAGGVGMILVNTSTNSLNADLHFVPTVHLSHLDRPAIKAYAAGVGTASIQQAVISFDVPAPLTAAFSSRGPLAAGGGDLLKPDVVAPGQDILAAVAPPGNAGLSFSIYSGTSMSSPHVAGLAALLKALHQDWSPMMIKSALMTTGYDLLDGEGTQPLAIFRQGAGHVQPNNAANPGLLFDSNANDWLAFLCGTTNGVNPAACNALEAEGYSLDPSDLNTPAIAIGNLAGVQTITRTVVNGGKNRASYTPSYTGMSGFEVDIKPATLTIGPGKSKSFTVQFKRTDAAAPNVYVGGQLTWSDGKHAVRLPMVVRPVTLAAPAEVTTSQASTSYTVAFGYDGPLVTLGRGLVPASTETGTIADDPDDEFSPVGAGVTSYTVSVPEGTTFARFSLFDAEVTPTSDLDLYVYRGTTLVGASGTGTSDETVDLANPAPGLYTVYVHGFGVPESGASFRLYEWLLPNVDAGNMYIYSPPTAVSGQTGTITLGFYAGLPAGRYLGAVVYSGTGALPSPTIVRFDKP